jgi:hypothetical protein
MMRIQVGQGEFEMRPIDQVRISEANTQDMIQRGLNEMIQQGAREYYIASGDVYVSFRVESDEGVCPVLITVELMRPERRGMVEVCPACPCGQNHPRVGCKV